MEQLTIEHAIATGHAAMARVTENAERLGFNTDAAREFVVAYLVAHGASWGEDIVDAAKASGLQVLIAHDGRAWGSVFASLARRNVIRCLRADGIRRHGNGTTGARQWGLVQ